MIWCLVAAVVSSSNIPHLNRIDQERNVRTSQEVVVCSIRLLNPDQIALKLSTSLAPIHSFRSTWYVAETLSSESTSLQKEQLSEWVWKVSRTPTPPVKLESNATDLWSSALIWSVRVHSAVFYHIKHGWFDGLDQGYPVCTIGGLVVKKCLIFQRYVIRWPTVRPIHRCWVTLGLLPGACSSSRVQALCIICEVHVHWVHAWWPRFARWINWQAGPLSSSWLLPTGSTFQTDFHLTPKIYIHNQKLCRCPSEIILFISDFLVWPQMKVNFLVENSYKLSFDNLFLLQKLEISLYIVHWLYSNDGPKWRS